MKKIIKNILFFGWLTSAIISINIKTENVITGNQEISVPIEQSFYDKEGKLDIKALKEFINHVVDKKNNKNIHLCIAVKIIKLLVAGGCIVTALKKDAYFLAFLFAIIGFNSDPLIKLKNINKK